MNEEESIVREMEEHLSQEEPQTSPEPSSTRTATEEDRSKLGRKVKALEEEVRTLTNLLEEQKKTVKELLASLRPVQVAEPEPEEELPEVPTTADDVLKIIQFYDRKKKREEMQRQQNYEKEYSSTLISLFSAEPPSLKDDIYKIWAEKYNRQFSTNPVADAEKAFLLAKVEALQKVAFKGRAESPQQPTVGRFSVPSSSTADLSTEGLKLARYLGLSDDEIKEAMKSDVIKGKQLMVKTKKEAENV